MSRKAETTMGRCLFVNQNCLLWQNLSTDPIQNSESEASGTRKTKQKVGGHVGGQLRMSRNPSHTRWSCSLCHYSRIRRAAWMHGLHGMTRNTYAPIHIPAWFGPSSVSQRQTAVSPMEVTTIMV